MGRTRLFQSLSLLLVALSGAVRTTGEARVGREPTMERFLSSVEPPLRSAVTRRHLTATTRGGAMTAWLDACTYLDGAQVRYRIVGEGGSAAVRRRALVAALEAEVKARRQGDDNKAALSPANYEFVPGEAANGEVRVALKPRRKAEMLVDGVMTLDSGTADLISVAGRLVKSPSFWTRHVEVSRRYTRLAGIRVPTSMDSKAQVLLLGASTFSMSYEYASVNGAAVVSAPARAAECVRLDATAVSAAEHHERGVAASLDGNRTLAAAEYETALQLDSPRAPSAAERALIARFAPRVYTTASEPFPLRDAAAILHPTEPLIAYHLFWGDDIDYPDDGEPCDHEVVWVRYAAPAGGSPVVERFWTYFHGRILDGGADAAADAVAHGHHPAVFVQWGKHGSMPIGWERQTIEANETDTERAYYPLDTPISLERYNRGTFEKLRAEGPRAADHPIARQAGWPRAFAGSWSDFTRFTTPAPLADLLRARGKMLVSRWNSAALDRRLVDYAFKPKAEWPDPAR